ncbi:hypothetical protein GCM10027066_26010 [Dyella jejuensis]
MEGAAAVAFVAARDSSKMTPIRDKNGPVMRFRLNVIDMCLLSIGGWRERSLDADRTFFPKLTRARDALINATQAA